MYYLRFFLSRKVIKHNTGKLTIAKSSPYYQDIEKNNDLIHWDVSILPQLLPDNYNIQADNYCLFEYTNKHSDVIQWNYFTRVEEYFKKSKYDYKIINHSNVICYYEYLNNEIINELRFEDKIFWDVLKLCNHKVTSLTELCSVLYSSSKNDIISVIKTLKSEGLLYHNDDFSEIVTPLNTDIIL